MTTDSVITNEHTVQVYANQVWFTIRVTEVG